MSKIRLTTLTPIHISSGVEFELNYNMLKDENFIYLYDEFKIAEFFIANNIEIASNLDTLKQNIFKYKNKIIASDLHFRKIENSFDIAKPLLSQVSSANKPIISGSSIKGSIRTAYIDKMVQDGEFDNEIDKLQELDDKIEEADFREKQQLKKDKNKLLKDIDRKITNKTKSIFKYIKISDTLDEFDTKVYKTINIKKEKSHQYNRSQKIEQIANFIEAIKPNQINTITININDEYFNDFGNTCNSFYKQLYVNDFNYYFSNKKLYKNLELSNNKFILNVGHFGGAELKSIEEIRSLKKTGSNVEWETSARTFGLESGAKAPYFENELSPFGWVLCEVLK